MVKVPRIIGPNSRSNMTMKKDSGQASVKNLGPPPMQTLWSKVEAELREAVELQLNEMEKLTDIQDYLAENRVRVTQIQIQQQTGFAVAGRPFDHMSISGRELMRLLEQDRLDPRRAPDSWGVLLKTVPWRKPPTIHGRSRQGNPANTVHTRCYPQRETDRDWRQRITSSDAAAIGKSHHVRAERGLSRINQPSHLNGLKMHRPGW